MGGLTFYPPKLNTATGNKDGREKKGAVISEQHQAVLVRVQSIDTGRALGAANAWQSMSDSLSQGRPGVLTKTATVECNHCVSPGPSSKPVKVAHDLASVRPEHLRFR